MKELTRKNRLGKFIKDFLDKFDEFIPDKDLEEDQLIVKKELRSFFLDGINNMFAERR